MVWMVWMLVLEKVVSVLSSGAEKLRDGICTKTGENLADVAAANGARAYNFKTQLKCLEENSKMLEHIESDVKAEVEQKELSGRKKRKRAVDEWFNANAEIQGDARALLNEAPQNQYMTCFTCSAQLEGLNKRMKEQIKQHNNFGDELVLDNFEYREELVVGTLYGETFRQNLREIVDWIKPLNPRIIGICGGDGASKKTLAMHVHNKCVEETSGRVYWVCVSENTSVKKLQDDISHAIHLNLENETNEDKRAASLFRALTQKANFVLILVNLKEFVNLEKVGFPEGVNGCRLIITTCSSTVCKRIGCERTFDVNMDEEKAWDMFIEVYGQDLSSDPKLEELKLAVRNLCNVPEKIVELAKTMKREGIQSRYQEWQYQLEEAGGIS